ncbi:MAG: glycosyltransferase family 4 protein [Mogibacterium sp.]|nr:glycosyltransferase family 4 protein [Mogibacterium sp.]
MTTVMPQSKSIWIINHYASHLENRHLELAKAFAENGYKVGVITSSYHHGRREYLYPEEYHFDKRAGNVYFIYLRSTPEYASNGGKRILNMLSFCRLVEKHRGDICELIGKPGYIIGSSAHPFVWETSYRLARKYKCKFIAEFRDIWPLSLIEIQGVSEKHPFVKLLAQVEKRAYKRSDAIVGTMPYAYKHVCDKLGFPRSKMHWMPNGINTDKVDQIVQGESTLSPELEDYLTNNWCCVYVGSIVKSECLDYILDAWKLVSDKSIKFAMVGEGSVKDHIESRIADEHLTNIKTFPAVKPEEVHKILSMANCCVAALEFEGLGRFGLSKYKLNDYLYSGTPTIFACNSPNVVGEAGHFAIPTGDPALMAEKIEQIRKMQPEEIQELADKGRKLIKEVYDYKAVGKKYLEMMENL